MKRITFCCFLMIASAVLFSSTPMAEEGMWTLDYIPKLEIDDLKSRGLELEPEQIYTPDGSGIAYAVVKIGGGTGSFVSPHGLIITNHHVAFTAIQRQSTPEKNYLEKGFHARSKDEELPAIGYHVYILKSFEDVTEKVLGAVDEWMSHMERYRAIDKVTKKIIRETEEGKDVECDLVSMYEGGQYFLFTYFKIKDVRLVFAPPRSIGEYGGEVDNWMWPRHAGDFTFLRAYVAPDGSSADYSEENVPYSSEIYLKLSSTGVKEREFVMLLGFPGRTRRYESSFSIHKKIKHDYPLDIDTRRDLISILENASLRDSSVAIRLSSRINGLSNYLKKNQGMLEGFDRVGILEHKMNQEGSLKIGLSRYPQLQKKYGNVLPELDSLFKEYQKLQDKNFVISWMIGYCKFLNFACIIYKWSLEKEKSDSEREAGYQNRDSSDIRRELKYAQVNLVPWVDKEILVYFLKKAIQLPQNQKIRTIEKIVEGIAEEDKQDILEEFVQDLYKETRLDSVDNRLSMFEMNRGELKALNDPFIDFAMQLEPEREKLRNREKEFHGALTRFQPKLIWAMAEYQARKLYPDANGTMRFNYGEVKGYSPLDGVSFNYITTLSGVLQKDKGEVPFNVPPELKQAYQRGDLVPYLDTMLEDVPVNFLTTNDITNGNSGSPVLNNKGELIGLAFDGNYESIVSDFFFEQDINRSINVDIRYVLFILDRIYSAKNLLQELSIN